MRARRGSPPRGRSAGGRSAPSSQFPPGTPARPSISIGSPISSSSWPERRTPKPASPVLFGAPVPPLDDPELKDDAPAEGIRQEPEGDMARLRPQTAHHSAAPSSPPDSLPGWGPTTSTGGSYVQAQVPSAEPGTRDLDGHAQPCARRDSRRGQHRKARRQEGGYEADQEARAITQREARNDRRQRGQRDQ